MKYNRIRIWCFWLFTPGEDIPVLIHDRWVSNWISYRDHFTRLCLLWGFRYVNTYRPVFPADSETKYFGQTCHCLSICYAMKFILSFTFYNVSKRWSSKESCSVWPSLVMLSWIVLYIGRSVMRIMILSMVYWTDSVIRASTNDNFIVNWQNE